MVEVAEAYSAIVSNENDTVVTFHVFLSVVCLRSANRMYKSHGIEMGLDKLRLQRRQCNFFLGGGGRKSADARSTGTPRVWRGFVWGGCALPVWSIALENFWNFTYKYVRFGAFWQFCLGGQKDILGPVFLVGDRPLAPTSTPLCVWFDWSISDE